MKKPVTLWRSETGGSHILILITILVDMTPFKPDHVTSQYNVLNILKVLNVLIIVMQPEVTITLVDFSDSAHTNP